MTVYADHGSWLHQPDVLRRISITAIVVILALAAEQGFNKLISCLPSWPDPIACSPPEVVLPHTDNEKQDQLPPVRLRFATVASATTATPCSDPGPKHSTR
jgi:hypothetical protein